MSIRDRKHNPGQGNQKDNVQMPQKRKFAEYFSEKKLFYGDQYEENKSPYNEIPACTVP